MIPGFINLNLNDLNAAMNWQVSKGKLVCEIDYNSTPGRFSKPFPTRPSHNEQIHSYFSQLGQLQIGNFQVHVQLSIQRSTVSQDAVSVGITDWDTVRARATAGIRGRDCLRNTVQRELQVELKCKIWHFPALITWNIASASCFVNGFMVKYIWATKSKLHII